MLQFILGIILGALIYYKLIKPIKFWADRNIPHAKSWPLIGNMGPFITRKRHFLDIVCDLYKKHTNDRYVGYMQFSTPVLMIRDLDLIKQIGVKEFDSFHDHLGLVNAELDPLLSKSLINLPGDKWKQMRATLSPAFTSSKMKNMYHLMVECAENLANNFKGKGQVDAEMKDLFSRVANDVIASTAFGIQVDSLKEPKHEFFEMGQKLTNFSPTQALKIFISQMSTKLAQILNMPFLPGDVVKFFRSLMMSNINKRLNERIARPDLIHLLLEARKGKLKHDSDQDKDAGFATVEESNIGKSTTHMELTDDHIIAQALLFFFAGFDTVSNASSVMAYELAVNPDVQKKLQDEIDEIKEQYVTHVPYEALMSMKYLDQVISETLRKWPPGFQTDRYCTKNYTVEPKKPSERALLIEKGMLTVIPIMSIHLDPQYFPEPERFDPERFNDKNKTKIVPGSYMPFGVGPRNCIGSRFALLEMKTIFFYLLSKFDIVPTEKTEIPLKISPKKLNLCPANGFKLGLKARKFTN